jgi:hypothetical protein
MRFNDELASSQTPPTPRVNSAGNQDIVEYIRGMAADLERLSQQAGLTGVAACLRATVCEARRVKNDERLLKLGGTPDIRLG